MNKLEKIQVIKKLYEAKRYQKVVTTAFSADGAYADAGEFNHEPAITAWTLIGRSVIATAGQKESITDRDFEGAARYIYLQALQDEKGEIEYHKLTD